MKTIVVHIETADVPEDVVREEIESWLDSLRGGAWAEKYGDPYTHDLDFGYRLFSSAEDAAAWERGDNI